MLDLRVRNLGGLIDDLRAAEAEPLVEAASAAVLSRDLKKHAVDAGSFESGERMPEQDGAQALAAVFWQDADVLNGPDVVLRDALDRAAVLRAAGVGGPIIEKP